jgi:hypothetical protein
MRQYDPWYDPGTEKSLFLAALAHTRHLCTGAEMTVPYMKMPGSSIVVQAIISAIDDYAERERPATANTSGSDRTAREEDNATRNDDGVCCGMVLSIQKGQLSSSDARAVWL